VDMFCYQCQEASRGTGCTKVGACGKPPEVAALQDLLIWSLKGLSVWGQRARELGLADASADKFVAEGLFATITNVGFDEDRFVGLLDKALAHRDALRERVLAQDPSFADASLPEPAAWQPTGQTKEAYLKAAAGVGVMADESLNEDVRSLRELIIYGLKGMAAYVDHARVFGLADAELDAFLQRALAATLDDSLTADDLVALTLETGRMGAAAMAQLDAANTGAYGNPEPTQVSLGVRPGPGILISGHDLRDLKELLEQTEGTGINVYTHGEMLPANAYPELKKHAHLAGNYGGSWWRQRDEFDSFNGPILMTTNCLVPPKDSYLDRLYTTGLVSWPGVPHIADRAGDAPKDFSVVIERALQCESPVQIEDGEIPIGFAHATVLSVADKVIEAIQAGAIKRFVVMAGCDGRQRTRSYYTELAEKLPEDTVILTAGCAKYRYNKLNLGDIGGIPRVLDAGQCNDSYSLVVIAQKLAEAVGAEHINDLPISYDIAWYEQKAVIVLLALLALGVKKIRLGPTLPAFLSPNVAQVIVDTFELKPMGTVEEGLASIAAGA
jgi:hydroxylamine reductase